METRKPRRKSRKIDRASPPPRTRLGAPSPASRSAVTNGSQLVAGIDGRSAEARRWRDVYRQYLSRTDGDEGQAQLCRSLATLIVMREGLDARLLRGEPVDPLHLVRVTGAINRILDRLTHQPPDVTARALDIIRRQGGRERPGARL